MMSKYDQIRELLNQGKGQFVSVTFLKKDGTERTMNVQPAAGKYRVKGEAASEPAKQAAKTRAERYPNLLNVWSVDKQAFRSINMDTVTSVRCNGETYEFEQATQ